MNDSDVDETVEEENEYLRENPIIAQEPKENDQSEEGERACTDSFSSDEYETDGLSISIGKVAELVNTKWILLGDFNLVRWMVDRSGGTRANNHMDLFHELISGLQLIDVPLKNCSYTWCSKRPKPVFSRLDRCFISPECNLSDYHTACSRDDDIGPCSTGAILQTSIAHQETAKDGTFLA